MSSDGAFAATGARRRGLSPRRIALVVVVVGMLITASATWAAVSLDRRNEHRLLEVQTSQAGALIASSILSLSDPLTTALKVTEAGGATPDKFSSATSAIVGPRRLFVSASLWAVGPAGPTLVSTAGGPALLPATSSGARAFVQLASRTPTFVVSSAGEGNVQRVVYAVGSTDGSHLVVYAERAIPANRRVPVESNSAFSDLDFATYLGTAQVPSALATTDVPADQLPLRGDTDSETIPFGNSTVLLVAAAHGHLGGPLGQEMPWVFLLGGIVLTAGAAATAHHLVVRRRKAEGDARTIAGLYGKLGSLYGEQRSIAVALQHALLPAFNPTIAGLEIASRYVAGARGVDIGGDWFSIVRTDEHHFAFVIGDVSGRGVSAATIMARLRYTIRAYLLEGHPPEHVLDMCARQLDIEVDGHFATILVGVGDLRTRELVLANAGHFDPLVITGTDAAYVVTTVGVPLGISDATYTPTVVTMPPGSTLLAFTDGLVERRGESIDDGLDRLRAEAKTPDLNLDHTLDRLITELTDHQSEDDIALLAFRWR